VNYANPGQAVGLPGFSVYRVGTVANNATINISAPAGITGAVGHSVDFNIAAADRQRCALSRHRLRRIQSRREHFHHRHPTGADWHGFPQRERRRYRSGVLILAYNIAQIGESPLYARRVLLW
jgi:hypothetical protein